MSGEARESKLRRIIELHEIEVAQRHKPIAYWVERCGDGWVNASTFARRQLDAAIYELHADLLDEYVASLPEGVSTEADAEASNLRDKARSLR